MANSHGIGVKRNDYHRKNRKENKGWRWRPKAVPVATGVRLVKRPEDRNEPRLERLNASENAAFAGVPDSFDDIPGYLGEVDIDEDAKDPRRSSLDPDMMIFFPPFLSAKVKAQRFAKDPNKMNDRWWEWEEGSS